MRGLGSLIILITLALIGCAIADDAVANDRIKVFLFGAVAFGLEVSVDMRNDTCHGLDNNLLVPPFYLRSRANGDAVSMAWRDRFLLAAKTSALSWTEMTAGIAFSTSRSITG
jgi:hypothetical protein